MKSRVAMPAKGVLQLPRIYQKQILNGRLFHCIGDASLLKRDKIGLICPRKCPASEILELHEKFKEWAENPGITVVSGFHSPLEKDCFDVLLSGKASMVWIPARNIETICLKKEWQEAVAAGRLLIISPFKEKRVSRKLCESRNEIVKKISDNFYE